jgi:hypothetical protein
VVRGEIVAKVEIVNEAQEEQVSVLEPVIETAVPETVPEAVADPDDGELGFSIPN